VSEGHFSGWHARVHISQNKLKKELKLVTVHYDMGFSSNVLGIQNGRAIAVYTLFGLRLGGVWDCHMAIHVVYNEH
jgi:hypothetical protein